MKYIIMPLIKIVFVFIGFIFLIFLFIISIVLSIWDWNCDLIVHLINTIIKDDVMVQNESVASGEKYWVNKTIIDFIFDRKTWRIKE